MQDRAFRRALGEFATGVAVVTARGKGGELIGLTMSSFNSVSLDPPLVLFSVDRNARSLSAMLEAKGFAVNILARDQEHISNQFARSLSNKWDRVKTSVGHAARAGLAAVHPLLVSNPEETRCAQPRIICRA